MSKKWTNDECKICSIYILENIGNLQRAFRMTGKDTGRPIQSIAKSYYSSNSTLGKYLSNKNIYEIIFIKNKL